MKILSDKKSFLIKTIFTGCFAVLVLSGCRSFSSAPAKPLLVDNILQADHDNDKGVALFYELGGEAAFVGLVQYLYRWHLDEDDFKNRNAAYRGKLWIRKIDRVLDDGDHSQFLEVVFPAIGVMVSLKKSDYTIDELQLQVKSDGYKITQVSRFTDDLMEDSQQYASLDMDIDALYQKLFDTRGEAEYPDKELLEYLRVCTVEQCSYLNKGNPATGPQTIWMAPLSTLANEVWLYWEDRKVLFRFVSDVDMHDKKLWDHNTIVVTPYDIVSQTIVSHEECPCKDSFLLRDQVGRVLFNCMAFGRKIRIDL